MAATSEAVPDVKGVITMTENEAILWIEAFKKTYQGFPEESAVACDMAISALKEIRRYREIGTVQECRGAVEKQKAKKHGTGRRVNGMGDLISRKSMIDILKGVDQEGLLTIFQIIEFIEDRPSAFDKEKVIEKLKRLQVNSFGYYNQHDDEQAFGESSAYRAAIEIVERGGI